MFYENQPPEYQENYKQMLLIMGNLTRLFSESNSPFLHYRVHENIFCKYFEADNLARFDCSVDSKKQTLGIGLKTWVNSNDQKIAEFGKLREKYKDLKGLTLIKKISEYRNERIRITKNIHGIDTMIYHIIKRVPNTMQIIECSFDYIDINNITLLDKRGNINNTHFTDGKNTYHFSSSKNTLYMIFENYKILDEFEVEIVADPYSYLINLIKIFKDNPIIVPKELDFSNKICLKLYSIKNKKDNFIPSKSGLNQWNAAGRDRNPNEMYIPFPSEDRKRSEGFFPTRETVFELLMPDGTIIPAKVCQDDGKAIMSNPNKILGKWLLRTVFEVPEGTILTYEMLEKFGIDCVVFTKLNENKYKIDFGDIGTYESFIENSRKFTEE